MDLQPEVHGLVYGSRTLDKLKLNKRKPYALPAEAVRFTRGSRTLCRWKPYACERRWFA